MALLTVVGSEQLGGGVELSTGAVVRSALGGDIRTLSHWVETNKLTLQFRAVSAEQRDEVIAFLVANLGLEINYIDSKGQTWLGVIADQELSIVQEFKACGYKIDFTLEGNIVT